MRIDLIALAVATKVLLASSFTINPSTSIRKPSPTTPPLFMAGLIDLGNIGKTEDASALSDGIVPKEMGVTEVFSVDLPSEIGGETKIFALGEGAKVKKHAHPGSGQYFVTNGCVKVSTDAETKTYGKGDIVIVPDGVEYELEAGEGDATIFYVYWSAESPE